MGLCSGEAAHFPLAPGEYFTSLWILIGYFVPPTRQHLLLTLGTSAGRSAPFGPQVSMGAWMSIELHRYKWEAISSWAGPMKFTGLLVEALGEWHSGGHRGFGVVQEPLESSNDEWSLVRRTVFEIGPDYPEASDHFCYQETVRSTASLDGVRGFQVRRTASRCLEIRILHDEGLDDFLGSWDPADVS